MKSISQHQHVPKLIKKQQGAKREERTREVHKRKRVEEHNKEGTIARKKERTRIIMGEEK